VFPTSVLPQDRSVVTLTGYFDESGTHAGSEAVAVAGFLATPGSWERFEGDWRAALADFGIDLFHMSPFAQRVGDYASWSEEERRERLARLLGIISEHVVGSVGVVIPLPLFDRLFSVGGIARRTTGGPYGLAMSVNILAVARIVEHLAGTPKVAYVFETGAVGRHEAAKIFAANLNNPESRENNRLLSLSFQGKREFAPLQAADILAYELHRELPRQPNAWGWLDEDQLTELAYYITLSGAAAEGE
jgi:hypothetical protein